MQRLITRTLLLVLFAGVFSPFAAASTMAVEHPHCKRRPVPAAASSEMSECHHHHKAAAAESALPVSSVEVLAGKDCCQDHECCRTMARSQWAHASLRSRHSELSHAEQDSAVHDSQPFAFEPALNHPGRAPPIL